MLERSVVRWRGWDYPHVDTQTPPHVDKDWIGQEFEWEHYVEVWRLYRSGQFVHFFGMHQDWRDQSTIWPAGGDWKAGETLYVFDTLFTFTEIFEFAARLAMTKAGDDSMHIDVTVSGLDGRALQLDSSQPAPLLSHYTSSVSQVPQSFDVTRSELLTATKELALGATIELMKCFGWEPPERVLREEQARLLR